MDHRDHVRLIRAGVVPGTWAELGTGGGAFTLALAELLGPTGRIVSVDRDSEALQRQVRLLEQRFPEVPVTQLLRDFRDPLELRPLDGLLMANSLHYVSEPRPLLGRLVRHLRPGGRFLLVEYDTDRGNPWVPHPIPWRAWQVLATDLGLVNARQIGREPSRFSGAIYAAVAESPVAESPVLMTP
jgi:ubiquinone/menaquinone biosynthesis C-methylase UbiE